MQVHAATSAIADVIAKLEAHPAFGTIRVIRASGELATDQDGEPVVRLQITLSDPRPGSETWPLEDVDALQQEAERLARSASADLPYVVTELYPQTSEQDGDTEPQSLEELSRALDSDQQR